MFTPNEDQQKAAEKIVKFLRSKERFFSLLGSAGTGKTSLVMRYLIPTLLADRKFVVCGAPTNKASKMLGLMGEMAGVHNVDYGTITQILGLKRIVDDDTGHQRWVPDHRRMKDWNWDVAFLDEASMIGEETFGYLERGVPKRCKVILMGDPCQLPPIGEKDSPALRQKRHHLLTQIMRHGGRIQDYVNRVRAGIETAIPLLETDNDGDEGVWSLDKRAWLERIIDDFKSPDFTRNTDFVRGLAWTNDVVDWGNARVHRALYGRDADPFVPGQTIITNDYVMEDGEPLLSASTELKIRKATQEKHEGVSAWTITADVDDGREVTIRTLDRHTWPAFEKRLAVYARRAYQAPTGLEKKQRWKQFWTLKRIFAEVSPIYFSTTHRAQGSTYNRAYVAMSDIVRNPGVREAHRCVYTAITRAAKQLIVAEP